MSMLMCASRSRVFLHVSRSCLSASPDREKKEEASEDESNLLEDPPFQDDLSDLNYQPQSQRYPRLHTVCGGGGGGPNVGKTTLVTPVPGQK